MPTKKSLAVMKSRAKNPDMQRLELIVPVSVKEQFKELAKVNRLTLPEMLATLIDAAVNPVPAPVKLSDADMARQLLADSGGNRTAAKRQLIEQLQMEFPGYKVNGAGTKKGGEFYEAQRKYKSVAQAVDRETKPAPEVLQAR
ncbi:hypothetical protein KI809_04370 [Geobacter pelophilus]|uniref:Uncharacterized protein n=1 Tax=Geoanaerobacter pelophilus TaxID=60036 RepID=A0AAW4L5P9_9BACT|nr:hypothetical protein [Geoanaerobacter pelophilus]MBT0663531.1 hypothetical protein [Geoanaerobacter pelophilus]